LPDIHEEIEKLQRILKTYDYVDRIVSQGDWMDSFNNRGNPTQQTYETIDFITEHIDDPKWTFLLGNHDIQYAFPIDAVICSGYNIQKQKIINAKLTDNKNWKKFKLLTWVGTPGFMNRTGNVKTPLRPSEWLVSHAGLHPSLIHPVLGFDHAALEGIAHDAMYHLRFYGIVTSFLAAGRGRGGSANVGGIDWLDWNREFVPIPGLNQIVGHTRGEKIRTNNIVTDSLSSSSYNYCIDTELHHVILVEDDGTVTIEYVSTD
jgi:hypothetical protein